MAIQLSKNGNAVKFDFDDNSHYLNDGTIEVPVNSLTLVTDESDMFTFKKAASDDIFISGLYEEIGMSKSELIAWYKDNMVGSTGGGGVTSGEVQTMIDESISGKADTSDVATVSSDVQTLSGQVETDEKVTATALNDLDNRKLDASAYTPTDLSNYYTKSQTNTQINNATSGLVETSAYTAYTAATDARLSEDEEVTSAALNELNDALDDKADTTAVTASISAAVSGKQDTLIAGTNITISGNVISAEGGGGGNNVIELTQAQYDALTDIDPDAFYIITDADGGATTGQVQTMINTAIATKQDTLVSGTNIKTINNQSLLGSGNIDMALRSEAVGGYQFGEISGVYEIQLKSVSNTNIGTEIYYPKINNKAILTTNGTWAQNNYNFQLVETSAYTAYTAATEARLAEDEEVTAAALNTLSTALGGFKLVSLTQAQYDALTVKDASTLYIITNVVN